MKLPRRNFLRLAAGAAALPAVSRIARAQAYPTRPVRLIVGFPAGGVADLFARLIGQWLSERLGQPFIIENRPGAGGNLAAEAAVKATPDGYTLLMVGSNNAFNVTLYDNLSFDFVRDIAPVGSIYRGLSVLVVHPSFPVKSVPDLIAYAKANPGKINMASGGVGSPQHVYGELFKMITGVDMLHVPYRGTPQAINDVLGGSIDLMFPDPSSALGPILSGRLKLLGVASNKRLNKFPDVPTIAESGFPGFEMVAWVGAFVPARTPSEIVTRLNQELNAIIQRDDMLAYFDTIGAQVYATTPDELRAYVAEDTRRWAEIVELGNIEKKASQ